jgi:protein-L-isoaspartate O-methyltransferase
MPGNAARDMRFAAAAIAAVVSFAVSPAAAQGAKARPLFVATPEEVVERMLRIAGTGPRDFVMDLGSGDGRIVIAAARDFGARGFGVDVDDELVDESRANARRAGVAHRVAFEERDMFHTNLSRATVVTVYQLPSLLDRLQPKFLEQLRPGSRIVAHAFYMRGWRPDRTEKVKHALRYGWHGDESTIYLWIVPVRVRGDWQANDWLLRIHQKFQQITIEGEAFGRPLALKEARLTGAAIRFSGADFSFRGRVGADRISGKLTRAGSVSPLVFARH